MEKKKISRRTVRKIQVVVATVMLTVGALTVTAFAETDANSAWKSVMDLIWEWVPKIGAAICAVGLIEFALGFKSEDADGKTRGLRTAAAGAMVIGAAVVGASLTGGTASSGSSSDTGTGDSAGAYVQTVDEINL